MIKTKAVNVSDVCLQNKCLFNFPGWVARGMDLPIDKRPKKAITEAWLQENKNKPCFILFDVLTSKAVTQAPF